jgi:secreted trypsin-like serine protease
VDSWGGWRAVNCLFAVLALTAVAPSAAVAAPEAKASIIGGEAASILSFPSLSYIQAETPSQAFACTGTVISPRVILTAAHCVENLESGGYTPASGYAIAAGFANPREAKVGNEVLRVSSTHVFPEFNPVTLHGDAGILILAAPTAAPPIALATEADSALFDGGATVELAGWGVTGGYSLRPPRTLRSVPTTVQEPQFCKQRTRTFYRPYSPAFQLCALDPPTLATGGCFGDSGGPAIARRPDGSMVEIGITSTGGPACNPRLPSIFTRTDRISTWASEWIAATESGARPPTLPRARVPGLAAQSAQGFVSSALAGAFGERFLRARELGGRCRRVGRAKVQCGLGWRYGSSLYYGTVTVFYVSRRNAVVWDNQFRISSVNAHCWRLSRHPRRCRVLTHRR